MSSTSVNICCPCKSQRRSGLPRSHSGPRSRVRETEVCVCATTGRAGPCLLRAPWRTQLLRPQPTTTTSQSAADREGGGGEIPTWNHSALGAGWIESHDHIHRSATSVPTAPQHITAEWRGPYALGGAFSQRLAEGFKKLSLIVPGFRLILFNIN